MSAVPLGIVPRDIGDGDTPATILLDAEGCKAHDARRGGERLRPRRRIKQVDVDFLCLAVFGARSLPDDMAERIERRRLFADGLAGAFERRPDLLRASAGEGSTPTVEAVAEVA